MADQKTIFVTVQQLDEPKTTQSGTPQRGVKTEQGWIKVRGKSIAFIDIGARIEISEPTEFKGAKYAELRGVNTEPPKSASPAAPAPRALALSYSNGAIKFDDYVRAVKNFHALAKTFEPDTITPVDLPDGSKRHDVAVDRSSARAAILNTFSIALTNGKLDMSEPAREAGADNVPPWEKGTTPGAPF